MMLLAVSYDIMKCKLQKFDINVNGKSNGNYLFVPLANLLFKLFDETKMCFDINVKTVTSVVIAFFGSCKRYGRAM